MISVVFWISGMFAIMYKALPDTPTAGVTSRSEPDGHGLCSRAAST